MDEHEAIFEIETKNDARAIERLLERLYDTLREESRTLRTGTGDSTEMLEQFESVLDAARQKRPGKLTIVIEQRDQPFEETQ